MFFLVCDNQTGVKCQTESKIGFGKKSVAGDYCAKLCEKQSKWSCGTGRYRNQPSLSTKTVSMTIIV